jgi:hypothetical protein
MMMISKIVNFWGLGRPVLKSAPARLAFFVLSFALAVTITTGARASVGGSASGSFDTMVPIDPMPITIIQQAQVKGILMVEFYLEAPNEGVAGHIHHLMPRLKDAFRTGISQFAAQEVRMDRPINLERLDSYISRETASVLHEKGVRVIFKQVMVQRR